MPITTALLGEYPTHLPIVADWIFHQWAILKPGATLENVIERLQSHLQTNELPIMVIALDGAQCIGTASLRSSDLQGHEDLSPWLASVYVPEERRRMGIGAALVQAVEIHAIRLGIRNLYLFTPDREDFYSAIGWESYTTTTHDDQPVVVMRRQLSLNITSAQLEPIS